MDNTFSNIDISSINKLNFESPKIDLSYTDNLANAIQDIQIQNQEKYQREIENNESLKAIVDYNQKISNYNKELVSLNERILKKINSLDDTLTLFNESFIEKRKEDKESNIEKTALLLELISILESEDKSKLVKFLNGLTGDVATGVLVSFLQMKLGIS